MATVWTPGIDVLADHAAADWIKPSLSAEFGAITRVVPQGYPAYVRVLHPAGNADDEPTTWKEVAAHTGRTVHARAQWHALVDAPDMFNTGDGLWPHRTPRVGSLAPAPFAELLRVLARYTTTPQDCLFGLWEGWGWMSGTGVVRSSYDGTSSQVPSQVPSPFTEAELATPRLHLPDRDYLLLSGLLSAAPALSQYDDGPFSWQSPNLVWPADHAWFVATEIDFDSTLIGGTTDLITDILSAPGLEAWPVEPTGSVAADADDINPTNPRALPPLKPASPWARLRRTLTTTTRPG